MSRVVELLCSRRVPHVAALALMSFGFAGCSADMQTRLSQNNPSPIPLHRNRKPPARCGRPRSSAASCRNIPARNRRNTSPSRCRRRSRRRSPIRPRSSGVSGGGRGLSSYAPPTHQPIETTATVAAALGRGRPRRPAQAGTTIIVGTSDTLDTLSRRYNVSSAAILQANGYKGPRALSPGQQLIIPRQTAAALRLHRPLAAPASKPVAAAAALDGSCRQSRRYLAQHRASQQGAGRRNSPRPTASTRRPNSSSARS